MCAMMQKLRMNSGLVLAGSKRLVARGDKIYLLDGCAANCGNNDNDMPILAQLGACVPKATPDKLEL
jgi:hypothetical protein